MKRSTESLKFWLGPATILTGLLLAAPTLAAQGPGNSDFGHSQGNDNGNGKDNTVATPEPATLTLLALGGGAAALLRYRKSRRTK
jgi:hypothetical protein